MCISVLILTFNEKLNLPNCLASLGWSDDIVVLDSGSEDGTQEIAEEYGARVVFRDFDNYASQRNYGLHDVAYNYPWVLMVDADEIITTELSEEMKRAVCDCDDEVSLFRIKRKDYLFGKWIKYSSGYPTWFGRLVRPGRVRVERAINEEYHTDGRIEALTGHLLHYPFNKGIHSWLEKHNRYSTMEAEEMMRNNEMRLPWKKLMSNDPVERRMAQKSIIYSLPGRPLLVFVLFYFVRGGFLDGRAGLTFCTLKSIYEYMINCKVSELTRRKEGLPV